MIKIGNLKYDAEQAIEVERNNTVMSQPVELGFDIQDNIKKDPIQVKVSIIIHEEPITMHGRWDCIRINNRTECTERMVSSTINTGTYEHLLNIRDNCEIVTLDCSNYAKCANMIYPDMAITSLGKAVRMGNIFMVAAWFTQITKTDVLTEDLYIQEATVDMDGEMIQSVLWSKESIEPTSTESLSEFEEYEAHPDIIRPPFEAMPSSIKPGLVDDICSGLWNWVSGLW